MSFFKNLWADLVEKRLWPVALLLLLVLVAVPVALGGSDEETPVSAAADAAAGTGAASSVMAPAQVMLDPGFPIRRDRPGKIRDPFKQRTVPGAATGATGAVGAPSAPSTAGSAGETAKPQIPTPSPGGGGAETAPSTPTTPTTPVPPKPSPPKADPLDSYAVSLLLGKGGTKRTRRTVERLTPLPSGDRPFLIYLGVLSDKKTAVFLVSSDAKASGQGTCRPRKSECETVELRRGDVEYFAVTGADGKITWYQLDVGRITKKEVDASRAVAAQRVARASSPKTVTKASEERAFGSDRYAYDDATGLVRRVKVSGFGAHLPSDDDDVLRARPGDWAPTEEAGTLPQFFPDR